MEARWDIAAVIIALLAMFVSASPAALALSHQCTRWFMCLIWPDKGRCRRILWSQIPDGRLHQCHLKCQHVDVQAAEPHGYTNCWDNTLGQVFNRVWPFINAKPTDRKYFTQKPYQLPFGEEYIQTDVTTLKAFLILTSNVCHSCDTKDTVSLLEIKNVGGHFTVHLKATGPLPTNPKLTKEEVDRFIKGYPPFYRTSFTTTGKITPNQPITGSSCMSWGGWVVAVGMANTTPGMDPTIGPICLVYNMQDVRYERAEAYWKRTLVMTAFEMIGQTLFQLKDFENREGPHPTHPSKNSWAEDALKCYERIMSREYSLKPWAVKVQQIEESALFRSMFGACPCTSKCIGNGPHSNECRRGQHLRKDSASELKLAQCNAALEIFNNTRHSEENLKIIWPVLPQILRTAILGMSEVEHYFSHKAQKLELPKELTEQQYIYLRQCPKDFE